MHIDKYKQEDGTYRIDNADYENAEDCYVFGVFNFCGCGAPRAALTFARDVLQWIDLRRLVDFTLDDEFDRWREVGNNMFHNDGIRYFCLYNIENLGLTEHGGCVPGWLTPKGQETLDDLNIILAQDSPQ